MLVLQSRRRVMAEKENIKVKNCLSAKEARQLTENSTKMLNIAFKAIKEEAEYGKDSLIFDVCSLDKSVIARITDVLTKEGYSVTEHTEVDEANNKFLTTFTSLLIKW
jgi:hypothetical protein